jgi:hypothetical protein
MGENRMKHAYLIIANKNPKQIQMLIDMLDDVRNDIFIMVDKKATTFPNHFTSTKSNVYMVPRINIYWGNYSQIAAEMALFKYSHNINKYAYYHLLSGQDLPLANQDTIHEFFDSHPNQEFIGYNKVIKTSNSQYFKIKIRDKIRIRDKKRQNKHRFLVRYKPTTLLLVRLYPHFLSNNYRDKNLFLNIYRRIEMNLFCMLPHKKNDNVDFASQWLSIDNDLIETIIKNEDEIHSTFSRGVLVDEMFIPTFINMHKEFLPRVYYHKRLRDRTLKLRGNLRYINWNEKKPKGSPEVITMEDYPNIKLAAEKGYLFARKFDINKDANIINKIYSQVLNLEDRESSDEN